MSTTTPNLGLFKYDPSTDGAQTFNIKQGLNDNWDKIDAAVKSLSSAAEYSSAQTYALGDYCTHDGKLYRCTTAITEAEAWTEAHWTETSVTAELIAIYTALQNKAEANHTHTPASIGAAAAEHSHTPASIGAAASSHTHAAGDVTSGTFDAARIPNLAAGKITSGTFDAARIPTLAASKVTTGTFAATGVKAANGTDYTTSRVRNIQASTTDLTAGSSSLANGDIYLVYE